MSGGNNQTLLAFLGMYMNLDVRYLPGLIYLPVRVGLHQRINEKQCCKAEE